MVHMVALEPVDYLVIGHITVDLTSSGPFMGGSAAYAALTAKAMGLRVGVVTVRGSEIPMTILGDIQVVAGQAESSTTFENVYTAQGRVQYIRSLAPKIDFSLVPDLWCGAKIIHLAPVAQEVDAVLPANFHPSLLGLTPQGWLRAWDSSGRVSPCPWSGMEPALAQAGALAFSVEDVARDENMIEHIAQLSRILVVTEGEAGARLFWHGDCRRFRPPVVTEFDPTGAGDIFAAAFFVRMLNTRDPWEAARFANRMAAISVTRTGLAGVPTPAEARSCLTEVLE
jgi:sugar/nucleoside kinase (ribokinase family)